MEALATYRIRCRAEGEKLDRLSCYWRERLAIRACSDMQMHDAECVKRQRRLRVVACRALVQRASDQSDR